MHTGLFSFFSTLCLRVSVVNSFFYITEEFINKATFKHPPLYPLPLGGVILKSPLPWERVRVRACGFTYEELLM